MKRFARPALPLLALLAGGCGAETQANQKESMSEENLSSNYETATFGAGCFWCVEAVFERIDGVHSVTPGYMGGHVENPEYRQISSGDTGHAEVARLRYDPEAVSYETLLDWFWRAHDPTTLNRQGADVGPQYRSVIFYHDEAQKAAAEKSREAAQPAFDDPIVTEISPAGTFYEAEEYHQDYYAKNPNAPYCQMVIEPKLEKLNLE